MTEEITLETIDAKEDTIIEKLDTIIGILNAHTTAINEILTITNGLTPPQESEETSDEDPTNFKTELEEKIRQGIPYEQVKEWIINKLTELDIYSEEDMVIKIFTHKTGDIILEFKVRPYNRWGNAIQFFQTNMGDADYFETSRYTMKNISWWKLNINMQMEEQYSSTDIVDNVNQDWGNNDQIFG